MDKNPYRRDLQKQGAIAGTLSFFVQTGLSTVAVAAFLLTGWALPEKVLVGAIGALWLLRATAQEIGGDETNERRFGMLLAAIEALEKRLEGSAEASVSEAIQDYLRSKDIRDIAGGTVGIALAMIIGNFALVVGAGWLLSKLVRPYL